MDPLEPSPCCGSRPLSALFEWEECAKITRRPPNQGMKLRCRLRSSWPGKLIQAVVATFGSNGFCQDPKGGLRMKSSSARPTLSGLSLFAAIKQPFSMPLILLQSR
jgi:hypothetical protein